MPLYPYRRRERDARQEATPPRAALRTRLPRGSAREGTLQRRRGAGLCPRRAGVAAAVWRRGDRSGAGGRPSPTAAESASEPRSTGERLRREQRAK